MRSPRLVSLAAGLFVWTIVSGCGSPEESPAVERPSGSETGPLHPVVVSTPAVLRGLVVDSGGIPSVIPCATCHSDEVRENPPLPTSAEGIGGPHVGLVVHHGDVSCASCHDQSDRSSLHLADGTSFPLTEAMRLCRQCHGPQSRDYDHGSHGGMRGYWDRERGPRERNHCISCHDPHSPAFGTWLPMPGPRDRFLPATSHQQDEESSHD